MSHTNNHAGTSAIPSRYASGSNDATGGVHGHSEAAVSIALGALDGQCSAVFDRLEELERRLEAVLIPVSPQPKEAQVKPSDAIPSGHSPLAQVVDDLARRQRRIEERLVAIVNRLEI